MKNNKMRVALSSVVKNPVGAKNIRRYYLLESVIFTKFIYWWKHNAEKEGLTERTVNEKMDTLRTEILGVQGVSLPSSCVYQEKSNMKYYETTEEDKPFFATKNFLPVESGTQYFDITTNVTRTISLGPLAGMQRKHYTLAALGMLDFINAHWIYGCTCHNLDVLASVRLWADGIDCGHYTSYVCGYIENQDGEATNRHRKFGSGIVEKVLEAGMVVNIEPIINLQGQYTICMKNSLLVQQLEKEGENQEEQYMRFENLTFVPLNRQALDVHYMNHEDLERVNKYQQCVYAAISPYLNTDEADWLAKECAALERVSDVTSVCNKYK